MAAATEDNLLVNIKQNQNKVVDTVEYHTTGQPYKAEDVLKAKHYKLEEVLGKGAFGTVHKVKVLNQGGLVLACKVIELKGKREKRLKEFKCELQVLRTMKHENIIGLVDHFIIDDTIYIFLEWAANGSLTDYFHEKNGILKEPKARRWFLQICRGIYYMHTKGIAHRDIKLGNILIDVNKNLKISDFGLSRCCYEPKRGVLMTSHYAGTVAYMAPEILMLRQDKHLGYDPYIADIWALGVLLFSFLAHTYPFKLGDVPAMLNHQLARRWKFIRPVRRLLSKEAKNLVHDMLDPDATTRITFIGIFSHPWLELNDTDIKQIFKH